MKLNFMRAQLSFILLAITFGCVSGQDYAAQHKPETFSIYLVRHAEKSVVAGQDVNPPLTECGRKRAESLNHFFKTVPLQAIYSTDFERTRSTAHPTAADKNLNIQLYDPRKLEAFSKSLIDEGQSALVVGHSNTTAVLAGLLSQKNLGPYDEDIYDRIYQVVFHENDIQLNLFHSTYGCVD